MPQIGEIKIVGNVHFIFVPEYKESQLSAHWASLNGDRIHIYESDYNGLWTVIAYNNDTKIPQSKTAYIHTYTEDEAFKNATLWAEE